MEEVDIVDGEDESRAAAFGTEGRGLVDGVPNVEVRHREGELSADVVTLEVVDIVAKSADVVLGDEKSDVKSVGKRGGVLLIPTTIVKGNLTKATHGVAEYCQVDENLLFCHCSVPILKMQRYEKKMI